ncbi:tatD [Mytilus edulis]|uniref:TatD n=1 Tax=Mytilus edulis TaxID=6550 RepID=A0A8S3T8W5_MYTED|nr:tatD [Mytilus edulis]
MILRRKYSRFWKTIGEVGLDYTTTCICRPCRNHSKCKEEARHNHSKCKEEARRNHSKCKEEARRNQEEAFVQMLLLARRKYFPVIIHCRDCGDGSAAKRTLEIILYHDLADMKFYRHCFDGTIEEMTAWQQPPTIKQGNVIKEQASKQKTAHLSPFSPIRLPNTPATPTTPRFPQPLPDLPSVSSLPDSPQPQHMRLTADDLSKYSNCGTNPGSFKASPVGKKRMRARGKEVPFKKLKLRDLKGDTEITFFYNSFSGHQGKMSNIYRPHMAKSETPTELYKEGVTLSKVLSGPKSEICMTQLKKRYQPENWLFADPKNVKLWQGQVKDDNFFN